MAKEQRSQQRQPGGGSGTAMSPRQQHTHLMVPRSHKEAFGRSTSWRVPAAPTGLRGSRTQRERQRETQRETQRGRQREGHGTGNGSSTSSASSWLVRGAVPSHYDTMGGTVLSARDSARRDTGGLSGGAREVPFDRTALSKVAQVHTLSLSLCVCVCVCVCVCGALSASLCLSLTASVCLSCLSLSHRSSAGH